MPTGKIGVYTRFFEYANFRLPLSTFLVNVLRHYHIHISQLSVIGAAKVSHFEIICRVHGFEPTVGLFRCFYVNSKNKGWLSFSKRQGNDVVCYTKPLDSLKNWNDHFFWVDAFACPASFPWNTSKSVSKDPFPKSSEFNAEHYATLVAYPAPFHKYLEPFLYLVGISQMDLLSFIQTANPTKVRVGERQRAKDEPRLLDTTMGRVVPLLPIAHAAESELDASVDKIFDEGGSGNQAEQGDSASGGYGVGIQLVSEAVETFVEDAAPMQPRRQRKRKTIVSDAGGPSHPPKKSMVQRLLAGAVQNVEVRGEPIPTLPFVTSSVFATLEREDEGHTDFATGLILRTIGAPPRFVISSDSSHYLCANIAEAKVDSFARPSIPLMTVATTVTSIVDPATTVKEKFVGPSVFGGDSSGGRANHTVGGFSDLTGSDFILGGIRTVISPDTNLQKVYVPQWSVTNGSRLDDGRTCREMVDEFAPPKLFASVREWSMISYSLNSMSELLARWEKLLLKAKDEEVESLKAQLLMKEAEAAEDIRLRAEASKFEVVEKSLRNEVKVLKEQNATLKQERTDLGVKVADLAASVKVREQEVADLDAHVTFAKSQSDNLADREKVTAYENFIDQLEKFQDEKMKEVNEKFDKLCTNFVEMTLHLEVKFYPHLLTTISGRQWLLTHGMELAIAKCLNSTEYLSTLRAAIGKAVEKGMQEGLSAGITHGAEGRKLTDVAAYNPSAEADYLSALQRLQSVNFSLIAELKANKDASVDTIMNLLRLEDSLADRLGLTESQPHVNQLMVPIHHSPDQRVIGAFALSLSLNPLSAVAWEGTEGTSGAAPGTADTTTTLSIVVASTSTVRPISIAGYEVTGADDQATADGNVADEDANPFHMHTVYTVTSYFRLYDHWTFRSFIFPQGWKKDFRIGRETLCNPLSSHSFPRFNH
ncbi:hypothetical protein Tco_0565497 [Tanacetum coccineum]